MVAISNQSAGGTVDFCNYIGIDHWLSLSVVCVYNEAMNPMMVAKNRTARLVREARKPAYTTETKPREHVEIFEIECDYGYRRWVSEREALELLRLPNYWLSDVDHSTKCWCQR